MTSNSDLAVRYTGAIVAQRGAGGKIVTARGDGRLQAKSVFHAQQDRCTYELTATVMATGPAQVRVRRGPSTETLGRHRIQCLTGKLSPVAVCW